MTKLEMDRRLLERVCRMPNGQADPEAMDFLANHWSPYVHAIDDIIDEEPEAKAGTEAGKEFVLGTFARAAELFSHPFYLRHIAELRRVVLLVTNLYADAVRWEHTVGWEGQWADHNRHAAMEMVVAVAQICGGYEQGRIVSREQRAICWAEHHSRNGKAV